MSLSLTGLVLHLGLAGCAQKDPVNSVTGQHDGGVHNEVQPDPGTSDAAAGQDAGLTSNTGNQSGLGGALTTADGSAVATCDGCDAGLGQAATNVEAPTSGTSNLEPASTSPAGANSGATNPSDDTNASTNLVDTGSSNASETATSTPTQATDPGTDSDSSTHTNPNNNPTSTTSGSMTSATSTVGTSTAPTTIPTGTTSTTTTSTSTTSTSATSDATTSAPTTDRWATAAPLFADQGILEIGLEIDEAGLDSLAADSKTYVKATLNVELVDGTTQALSDVGVRLKGQLGSFRTLDLKAAFLLKMNEFVSGQKLLGLNKLALNNMVQDASMLREQLSYLLFRAMNVAAPRTGYARVTLNGELMGLYATVEATDNGPFLDHWFGDDNGSLYEGAYGSDVEDGLIETFDQDRGEDLAFADLYELSDALDTMLDASTFVDDISPWLDLDAYARFAATELFLAHWDGYAATRNNFFLYRAPEGKWTFLPWGTDQTFGDFSYEIFNGSGRIQRLCLASLPCRQKLAQAVQDVIGLLDDLDMQQRIDDLETLITSAAEEDPRKEADNATFHAAIEELRDFVDVRTQTARDQLICTDPADVDEDNDGASGCDVDCDDNDPARKPSSDESCNFIDDNCDGQIDEPAECERCKEVERDSGGTLAFCVDSVTYEVGRLDCVDRGGTLVAIHSDEEQTEVETAAAELEVNEWWIGLSDGATEGEWLWEDDSSGQFDDWSAGEPNDSGGTEDCAYTFSGGGWNDTNCASTRAYICQLP